MATQDTAGCAPAGWILSPFWDSLLFIGAPALCMAALLPLRAVWSSEQIAVLLLAFFTFGHHFPTFLRAYGDRELFARYRWRFLLAPPVIFATAMWFDANQLHGLAIFVFAWDIWHVLMQHYGFMRIYDAKQGVVDPLVARLDRAVAISWYVTLILASPPYRHNLLSRAYQTGLPMIPADALSALRIAMTAATALLTLVYVVYHFNLWRTHRPVSLRKLVLFGIFLAATYYLCDVIDDFVVGFCVWSAFHCVQYYGIVWAFNRNRVARNSPMTSLIRFLFRPRPGLVLVYAGLIFAYGSLNLLAGSVSDEFGRRLMLAFVFASNALHYYYDGFIWKVGEPQTRQFLDIASVAKAISKLRPGRGLVQAAYLTAAVVVLALLETSTPNAEIDMRQALAAIAPDVPEAQYNLGNAFWREGRLNDAAASYRETLRLKPMPKAHSNLGAVLYESGQLDEAIAEFRQALAISRPRTGGSSVSPNSPLIPAAASPISADPFIIHTNLADALSMKGNPKEALEHYRQALRIDPRSPKAHAGLGATLAELGQSAEAVKELEFALTLDPGYAAAHLNLAALQVSLGQTGPALEHYRWALSNGDDRARRAAQAAIQDLRREK